MFSQKVLCLFVAAFASVAGMSFDPTKTMQPGVDGYKDFVREIQATAEKFGQHGPGENFRSGGDRRGGDLNNFGRRDRFSSGFGDDLGSEDHFSSGFGDNSRSGNHFSSGHGGDF